MSHLLPTFVVGSGQILTGVIYENIDGVRTSKDLSGATVAIKAIVNDETVASWPATQDPDQVNNRGKYSFQLTPTSITEEGDVLLQAWVTIGGGTPIKSAIVEEWAQRSLA